MPSIGNIVVKRIIEHKLLPPVLEPIVKGPALAVEQAADIARHIVGLMPPGGKGGGQIKQSAHGISQTVVISDSVVRVKVSGVTGISFTQTSFTFTSYTITGAPVTKSLSDTITISEPLTVQRAKTRVISDSDATETSETLDIVRTKTRALAETDVISEAVVAVPQTNIRQTLSETDAISESIATFKESKRLQTETVSESGTVDLLLPGIVKALSESVTIGEGVIFEVTHAGGTNITKTLDETTPISDVMDRQSGITRAFVETITMSEGISKTVVTTSISFTDTSFTDTSYGITVRAEYTLVETTEESHTVRMALTKNRGITESVTIELSFDSTGDSFDYDSFD
jgi:hypothetical protein